MKKLVLSLLVIAGMAGMAGAEDTFTISPDVVYGHKAGMALTFDVIQPRQPNGVGVLFMMSGGWVSSWIPPQEFVGPKPPFGMGLFRDLVDRGYTLFIVRHGSSPQFKVPEAVADVRRAVRYIRLHADEFKIDPNRIGVCGASAGGHLSLMLGTTSDEGSQEAKDEVDRTSDRVAAVVAYCPPVALREFFKLKESFPALDFDPTLAESFSPLSHVTADDPPALLVHGDKDELVPIDNSQRIVAEFKKQNVPAELLVIEGAGHGFGSEGSKRASQALVEWFDKYLAAVAQGGDGASASD